MVFVGVEVGQGVAVFRLTLRPSILENQKGPFLREVIGCPSGTKLLDRQQLKRDLGDSLQHHSS